MRKRRNTSENKQLLLETGLKTIIQQGYNHTGIQQIVDAVEVPKGSFYNYFDSKESFGEAVVQYYAQQIRGLLDHAVAARDIDALSSLKQLFMAMIAMYQEKHFREGCLIGNLAAELADTNEVIRLELARVFADWEIPTTELLARAQDEGTVRKDIPAGELAAFLWNTFEGSLLRMKIEKSIDPLNQWFRFFLQDFVMPKGSH